MTTTVFLEKTEGTTKDNGLLEKCDPCRRCPLYKGTGECCTTGQTFDAHDNMGRLTALVIAAVTEKPQTLGEIAVQIVQQTGNRMNFRRKKNSSCYNVHSDV